MSTTAYPQGAIALSCAASSGYVYCIGGENTVGTLQSDSVYYAQLSSKGVGAWTSTTNYPLTVDGASCTTTPGYIYCVGGFTANGPMQVNATYYAPISSKGVETWSQGPEYPAGGFGLSCVAVEGHSYCVGGQTVSGSVTDSVYYSSLSSSGGFGPWIATASYPTPIFGPSCVSVQGTIACIGGGTTTSVEGQTQAVYYTNVE